MTSDIRRMPAAKKTGRDRKEPGTGKNRFGEGKMLQLIRRCPEYAEGYKAYCREFYDRNITFFRPSDPKYLEGDWFLRTKDWYDRQEKTDQLWNRIPEESRLFRLGTMMITGYS